MKHTLFGLICICILFSSCSASKKTTNSQASKSSKKINSFEGKVIYDFTMKDRSGEMSDEQCNMLFGKEQVMYYKGDQYFSEFDGMMNMKITYLGGDTLFTGMNGMEAIMFTEVRKNNDPIIDHKIEKGAETINGILCDLLTIESKDGIDYYYYNEKYAIDPAIYKNHVFGHWSFYLEKSKALPLKIVSDMKDFYTEITMKEVIEMKIDASLFSVPDLPRMENPDEQ